MKLKELKNLVDQAVEYAGDTDPDVEVYFKEQRFDIHSVGQFHLVPDVIIAIVKHDPREP